MRKRADAIVDTRHWTVAAPPRRSPAAYLDRRLWTAAAFLLLLNLLVGLGAANPIRTVVVLPLLVLLPGRATVRLLGLTRPAGWDTALHVVAFGLLWLLAISFAVSVVPVSGALSTTGCLVGFDLAVVVLTAGTVWVDARRGRAGRNADGLAGRRDPGAPRRGARATVGRLRTAVPPAAALSVALAALAVCLAVAGAARLNAGGRSGTTELAFAAGALAALLAMLPFRSVPSDTPRLPGDAHQGGSEHPGDARQQAREQLVATTLFLLGLAVLFATSLRGNGVTGHDVKIEFRVFQDTLIRGRWEPGGIAPDYNACLSLTTLPAMLRHLLGVAPIDVFRVVYQVIFAVVPVAVYLVARRRLDIGGGAMAGTLFIAFPTFVNDLPMLNRQGMALVFFTVMVLALLDERGSRRIRQSTFVIAAAGLTVSHYSSTYVAIGILGLGWILLRLSRSAERSLLTWRLVAVVLLFAFGWSLYSASGSGLTRTVRATLVAVVDRNGAYSDAVGYTFFRSPGAHLSDEQVLRKYVNAHAVSGAVPGTTAGECPMHLVAADTLPVTRAGRVLEQVHVSPGAVSAWSRRAAVVLFEGGVILGIVLLWVRRRGSGVADRTQLALASAAMALSVAAVVLPQLSLSYPLTRLYQQSLVLFAPLIVLAVTRLLGAANRRWAPVVAAVVVVGCFVSTSGLLPQLLGGYPPQLNLNNAGQYFRAWYASADDVAAVRRLDISTPRGALLAMDSADTALLRGITQRDAVEGGVPGTVPATAYLQVTSGGTDEAQAVVVFDDRILLVRYPLRCVATGRPLLHVTGRHRLYGPQA
ncbi:MAG TPA: hypothetical protein VJT31_32785 [Rugosimonospora sp.]|nr:hypothetical protein [Rugosimonospora sp.]